MSTRPSPDPMSSMWAWAAHDLRFYRERRGLSGQEVTRTLHCARSTVSRLETGEARMDEQQAMALDKAWNTGGHFLRIVTYARLGHDPDWLKQYGEYEARASMIRICNGQLVPGLLQTSDYARALLVAGRNADLEMWLEKRIARQEIMNDPNPPDLWVLIAEGALEPLVGGRAVMCAQLARLLEESERSNLVLRVVPKEAGANQILDGSFKIIRVKERDVAFAEAPGGGRLILGASEVQRFGVKFDLIGADALSRDASRRLIAQLMETMA